MAETISVAGRISVVDTLLNRRAPKRKGWPLYLPGQAPRWSAKREPTRGEYVAPGRHLNLTSVASFVDKDRAPSDNPRSRTVRSRAPRNPGESIKYPHFSTDPRIAFRLPRVAIDLGPVVVDASDEIFGDVPNVAARAQPLAEWPGVND